MFDQLGFVIVMEQGNLEYQTTLLIESIRRLASLRECPIYVIQPRPGKRPSQRSLDLLFDHEAVFISTDLNKSWSQHGTMNKVYASAFVEELTEHALDTLVFLDSDILFVNPPHDLTLDERHLVAVKPVDLQGLGQPVDQSISAYWEMIFEACGVRALPDWHVTTTIDRRRILPYFNEGVAAVRPSQGIFRRWRDNAERLAHDQRARSLPAGTDEFFFLNQALFAGTLLAEVPQEQIRLLDQRYNYSLRPRRLAPAEVQRGGLEELVIVHYHKKFYSEAWMDDIDLGEPHASWLRSRLPLRRRYRRSINLASRVRHSKAGQAASGLHLRALR
jgi:lipopolysaccharide biosynthesis glycosyltransferase